MLEGYYNLTDTLNITRSVSIRAAKPGKVVLNGQRMVQVLHIETSGTVDLIELEITGGTSMGLDPQKAGGVSIYAATVTFTNAQIHHNWGNYVRLAPDSNHSLAVCETAA